MENVPSTNPIRVWARLIRVQQQLLDKVEAALKQAGWPPLPWYDVLLELQREESGRLRYRELHGRLLIAKHNLSRLIDRLEAEALVTRERVEEDARGACIAITGKGREVQQAMWPVYSAAIARHFSGKLTEADLGSLTQILVKLQD